MYLSFKLFKTEIKDAIKKDLTKRITSLKFNFQFKIINNKLLPNF